MNTYGRFKPRTEILVFNIGGVTMRSKAIFTGIVCLLCAVSAFGQGRGGGPSSAPPKTDMVTPEVPGVVKAGTKIEIVKYGLGGDDAGVGMPDGSVLIATGGASAKSTQAAT